MNENFIFYKPKIQNFGDALNEWLLPRLFQKINPEQKVLGIGSIYTQAFFSLNQLDNQNILVLGSGARGSNSMPSSDVHRKSFFRGPLTSSNYISDGAYFLRQDELFKTLVAQPKKHKVSIVPYFRSLKHANWDLICASNDINLIDPTMPNGIEFTLKEIAASELVIAEAMHGAIVADALRVPWVKLNFLAGNYEGKEVNEFKWNDWIQSIDLKELDEMMANSYYNLIGETKNYRLKEIALSLLKRINENKLKAALEHFLSSQMTSNLSSNDRIAEIDKELAARLEEINDVGDK